MPARLNGPLRNCRSVVAAAPAGKLSQCGPGGPLPAQRVFHANHQLRLQLQESIPGPTGSRIYRQVFGPFRWSCAPGRVFGENRNPARCRRRWRRSRRRRPGRKYWGFHQTRRQRAGRSRRLSDSLHHRHLREHGGMDMQPAGLSQPGRGHHHHRQGLRSRRQEPHLRRRRLHPQRSRGHHVDSPRAGQRLWHVRGAPGQSPGRCGHRRGWRIHHQEGPGWHQGSPRGSSREMAAHDLCLRQQPVRGQRHHRRQSHAPAALANRRRKGVHPQDRHRGGRCGSAAVPVHPHGRRSARIHQPRGHGRHQPLQSALGAQ